MNRCAAVLTFVLAACVPPAAPVVHEDDTVGTLARVSRGESPRPSTTDDDERPHGTGRWLVNNAGRDDADDTGDADGRDDGDDARTTSDLVSPFDDYRVGAATSGTIVGSVRDWPATTPSDVQGCPAVATSGVAWLEGVRQGAQLQRAWDGALSVSACGLAPRVQLVAPIGGALAVSNPTAQNATLTWIWPGGTRTAIVLAAGSDRVVNLTRSGRHTLLRSDGARAWLVVAPTPYAAPLGPDGHFRFDGVPTGTFSLVVLIPPARAGAAPRELHTSVTIHDRQTTTLVLVLAASRGR